MSQILYAWERRLASQRVLAGLFGFSVSFIEKLIRRYRTTGDIAPKPHAGGPRLRLDTTVAPLIRRLMHDHADLTLEELCARVAEARGVRVSVATMCRLLQRLGLPRKKSRSMRANAIPRASNTRARTTARRSRRSTSSA